jgi:hypothetical protein
MTRLSMLCVCLLAACGGGGGGGDDMPGADAAMNEPIVNGLPASQYYAQFAYQMTSTGVEGAAAFPATSDGRNAFLVTFFLMPNNSLQLFYAEGEGDVTATGWSLNVHTDQQKKRSGMWKVEGAQLVLDSYMRCDGMLFNDKPALRCTLTAPIITAAAQSRSGTFKKRISASSPDSSEFAQYVP